MGADEVNLGLRSLRHEKYHKILYCDIKHKARYVRTSAYNKL